MQSDAYDIIMINDIITYLIIFFNMCTTLKIGHIIRPEFYFQTQDCYFASLSRLFYPKNIGLSVVHPTSVW